MSLPDILLTGSSNNCVIFVLAPSVKFCPWSCNHPPYSHVCPCQSASNTPVLHVLNHSQNPHQNIHGDIFTQMIQWCQALAAEWVRENNVTFTKNTILVPLIWIPLCMMAEYNCTKETCIVIEIWKKGWWTLFRTDFWDIWLFNIVVCKKKWYFGGSCILNPQILVFPNIPQS